MSTKSYLIPTLTLVLASAGTHPLMAQNEKEELKLNQEAVKMIQFDFTPHDSHRKMNELLEQPLEKRWMKFKEDLAMPRHMTDTAKLKKPEDYIRAEPYTIWTAFGEDPVYDVLPGDNKKWKIHWKLDPYRDYKSEYGHDLIPVTGGEDPRNRSIPGVGISVDIDKFLFENFTKRGRMLRRNRKHANAWKTYAQYVPTPADSAKFPSYRLKTLPVYPTAMSDTLPQQTDSIRQAGDTPHTPRPIPYRREQSADTLRPAKPAAAESSYERYIRQRAAQDSVRRQELLRRDKVRNNAYDIDRQIRRLQERR